MAYDAGPPNPPPQQPPHPYQQAYTQQVVYHQLVRAPSNPSATASLVLGILGVLPALAVPVPIVGIVMAVFAGIPGLLAVIFGHLGFAASRRLKGLGRGNAVAGLILGYITLGIIVAITLVWIVAIAGSTTSGTTSP